MPNLRGAKVFEKAGIHASNLHFLEAWAPAFAGVTGLNQFDLFYFRDFFRKKRPQYLIIGQIRQRTIDACAIDLERSRAVFYFDQPHVAAVHPDVWPGLLENPLRLVPDSLFHIDFIVSLFHDF
jgi:hypothetical protein